MTLILDAFDGRRVPLSLEEVARRARLPRSTVHRILNQMLRFQWIEHETFGYRLGRRALGPCGDERGHGEIREAAAARLHELHLRTGLVAHLSVLDGCDVVFLDKVGGASARQVPSRVGGRVAAHHTADGKSMLAGLAPETVDSLYLPTPPSHTVATPALHLELSRIRQRGGLAFHRDPAKSEFACVAAAVRSGDATIAAVSLCGDGRDGRLKHVAPLVAGAARAVSRILNPKAA
ncbi:IclR family transcriptional regulator [Nocardia stercoris]|nr:IclR family transcriptional regulator C-terminal domain-containing protein [Nocardia stercoris]